ncbi:RagB/SusD family nutrient uptake outer membrane protein [Chitinophaga rhizophila]|uniref:RagB/SusD family nutrient uptake outer membrane protein n=1 Tax=Chitinophaga rhizophila TaxID=2866212 RepID=A0ABS7G918_9BACT|nr:RagB/SusD family nutrient uptake outer membrane protein [Chitinophaga rhizophila]MBW8684162.1 RagB/SusD family nutrient uptake outer membrane protein [Chitinophaga rhizophila]
MKRLLLIIICCCCTALTGCNKLLDINSSHAVSEENFWNSHQDTRTALIGVYGLLRAALADNNAWWMYGEFRKGDFYAIQRQDMKALIRNDLRAAYPLLEQLSNWRRFYAVINAANMFLENVGNVRIRDPKYSEENMRVDIAQMRCIRAYVYFFLVSVWGDVPLITASHDGQFTLKARESKETVLAFVEKELLQAAADLPYKYSANDPQQSGSYYNETNTRWSGVLARKHTAYAILAHVAAWQGKYVDASVYGQFVLDNYSKGGSYYIGTDELVNSNGFFKWKKDNHILGFNFDWGHVDASFSGHLEELTLAAPVVNKALPDIYVPKDTILSLFNLPVDERFSLDTLTGVPTSQRYFTNFNSQIPIFSKIKVIQDGNVADPSFRIYSSTIIITRLENIALLQAEALAVIGQQQRAIDLLNTIRDLRRIKRYDSAREGDLIDAIFRERRKELMGEGWRWFDLIRYNKIKQNDPAFMSLINSGGIFWPVSDDVMKQNPLITQNPYWQ